MKTFLFILFILIFIGPLWILISGQIDWNADYRTANRQSSHIAPLPKNHPEAIIQIYAARAFNWHGLFSSHIWIAIKPHQARKYIVLQIVGWRLYYGLPALAIESDIPDRYWFGQKPHVILDIRGDEAKKLIPQILSAAKSYPYRDTYRLWPGPNSNTFPAYIGRQVPDLKIVIPSDAIGKDFMGFHFFAVAPSNTGYQFSFFGIFGILIAKIEGIELNLMGFVFGIRFSPFSIELPGIGPIRRVD